jgi:hypothetical protein
MFTKTLVMIHLSRFCMPAQETARAASMLMVGESEKYAFPVSPSSAFANPKSNTFTWPSAVTKH